MVRVFLIFMVGASLGSFSNLVAWRIAHRIPNLMSRSRCIGCAVPLHWFELIPVLGFVRCGGRCRRCSIRIPFRFPALEILCGGILVALLPPETPSPTALWMAFMISFIHITSEVDRMTGRIPNGVTAAGFVFGAAHTALLMEGQLMERIGVAALAGGVIWGARLLGWLLYGRPGMGIGDVKLAATLGLLLGPPVFVVLYAALMLAGLVAMAGLASARLRPGSTLPFAPYLGGCTLVCLLVPGLWTAFPP